MKKVKLSNKWKETLNKASNGDIWLCPETTYFAQVTITHEGQTIDILKTPYEITLPKWLMLVTIFYGGHYGLITIQETN